LVCGMAAVCLAARASSGNDRALVSRLSVFESFRISVSLLRRDKALLASSLVNVNNLVVMILGNSFFPLTLDVPLAELSIWVLSLLVVRDGISVITGMIFRSLARRLKMVTVLLFVAVGNCGGTLL